MEKQKTKPEFLLQDAIGFSEDDLEANREGYLSIPQQAGMRSDHNFWLCSMIVLIVIFAMFAVLGLSSRRHEAAQFLAFMMAGVAGWAFMKWYRVRDDMNTDLRAVEGRVKLDIGRTKGEPKYSVEIDDVKFNVKKDVFLAFKNGDPYCIYYAPHTKRILSVDWLR
jgi:hypothetical protein